MLQIQNTLIKSSCSFSLSPLSSFCEDIAKALLKNDQHVLSHHLAKVDELLARLKQLKGKRIRQAYVLVDVLFFNLSMALERGRIIFENMLVESTGSEEFDQKKVVQRAQELNRDIEMVIKTALGSKHLLEFLKVSKEQKGSKIIELSCLWQTVEFLVNKYNLDGSNLKAAKKTVEHLLMQIPALSTNYILSLNKLLFGQNSKQLIQVLQTMDSSNYFKLYCILHSNEPKRQIFSTTVPTHQVISNIMAHILKANQSQPTLLFSNQHYNASPQCAFLVNYMLYQYGDLLVKFSFIFRRFVAERQEADYYTKNSALLEEINQLLQSHIPSGFSYFVNTIFKVITARYTTEESIEILKLLVFNRFLLNPDFVNLIEPVTQQFSTHANRIKNVFFPTKLKNIEQIVPISLAAYSNFSRLCQTSDKAKSQSLFLADKILYISYSHLQSQLTLQQKVTPHRSPQTPNLSMQNTSLTKNILNELESRQSVKEGQVQSEWMMRWLQEYKMQVSHRQMQRRRYRQACEGMDARSSEQFKQVSERFKQWRESIEESKRMYKMNSVIQY